MYSVSLVKAAFWGFVGYFNTLLFGYFSLLFPTIAVTMLFCFHSSLIDLNYHSNYVNYIDYNYYRFTSHVSFIGSNT